MKRFLNLETVPGLLSVGLLLGLALFPVLWLARLGVGALRERSEARSQSRAGTVLAPRAALSPSTPAPAATPQPLPAATARPAAGSAPTLAVPVRGVRRAAIADTFDAPRGARRHHAVDILAPRGTPVLAATAGHIARLSRSRAGGLELYLLDESSRYCLYYAHLLRYARGLRPGGSVAEGSVLAYVGVSGNAPLKAPHLHFAVTRNTAPGRCDGQDLNPLDLMR